MRRRIHRQQQQRQRRQQQQNISLLRRPLPLLLLFFLLVIAGYLPCTTTAQEDDNNNDNNNTMIDLPLGPINVLIVTDVHSWVGGHGNHYHHSSSTGQDNNNDHTQISTNANADYGHVVSFYQRLKAYCLAAATANNNNNGRPLDLWFVMNGDLVDGTGLALHGNVTVLVEILKKMPWDIVTTGNHELYEAITIQQMTSVAGFIDWWDDKYISSNVVQRQNNGNVFGNAKYKILHGQQGNVLVFAFLYNMKNNNELVIVQEVEQVMKQDWFVRALQNKDSYDAILVMAHMGARDSLLNVILQHIRKITNDDYDVPVQFVTGHTHVRDYLYLDPTSTSMEAGKYLDTVGFVSFPTRKMVQDAKHEKRNKPPPTPPTPPTPTPTKPTPAPAIDGDDDGGDDDDGDAAAAADGVVDDSATIETDPPTTEAAAATAASGVVVDNVVTTEVPTEIITEPPPEPTMEPTMETLEYDNTTDTTPTIINNDNNDEQDDNDNNDNNDDNDNDNNNFRRRELQGPSTVVPYEVKDDSDPVSSLFKYRMIDANVQTFQQILGLEEVVVTNNKDDSSSSSSTSLDTQDGKSLSRIIHKIRKDLGLLEVVGCLQDTSYALNTSIEEEEDNNPDDSSLWRLWRDEVVPYSFETNHVIFLQKGAFRFDLLQGEITVDDIYAVAPFNDTFVLWQTTLTAENIYKLNDTLNAEIDPWMAVLPNYIMASPAFASIDQQPQILDDTRNYTLVVEDYEKDHFTKVLSEVYTDWVPEDPIPYKGTPSTATSMWMRFVKDTFPCKKKGGIPFWPGNNNIPKNPTHGTTYRTDQLSDTDKFEIGFVIVAVIVVIGLGSIVIRQKSRQYHVYATEQEHMVLSAQSEYEEGLGNHSHSHDYDDDDDDPMDRYRAQYGSPITATNGTGSVVPMDNDHSNNINSILATPPKDFLDADEDRLI